ncbi:MAG: nickel pincer cofactor biosynthesis protein LarB [Bilophila wadsworthia]
MAARTGGAGLPSAFTPAAWCFGIFQKTGKDMDHGILFDHARTARIGLPEAVFCEGKPSRRSWSCLRFAGARSGPVHTACPGRVRWVHAEIRAGYDYHPLSRTAFGDALPPKGKGRVAVISAGTADGFVAWEAARTLAYLGIGHKLFEDCGVAGLWRLAERLEEINTFDAVIVVAGLDAALVSVMGGLTPKPIFGVPTSVGYGAAQGGRAALASMLSSCAPGVGIMNIDNGYGAACAAARVVNGL